MSLERRRQADLGGASPEAQVEYLMKIVAVKDREIASLQLQFETQKLEAELQSLRLDEQLRVLEQVARDLQARGDNELRRTAQGLLALADKAAKPKLNWFERLMAWISGTKF